jgi:hypothetical protein
VTWAAARAKLAELFGIDVRSLALFRVSLGLAVLIDVGLRARDLRAHYTDDGLLPRSLLLELYPRGWSVFLGVGSQTGAALLFGLTALVACALIVGYRTRLATVVCWVLVTSLQARNPPLNQAGEVIVRGLLFWGAWLPLGACASLDVLRLRGASSHTGEVSSSCSRQVLSAGTVAILLQVCFVYWFAAALKNNPAWTVHGTAVALALRIDMFVLPFGSWLLQFPEVCRWLTLGTWWFELLGPALVFVPVFTGPVRTLVVLGFIGLHVGFGMSLRLGPFWFQSVVCWLPFLPAWFWDRPLASRAAEPLRRASTVVAAWASRVPLSPPSRWRWPRPLRRLGAVVIAVLILGLVAQVLNMNLMSVDSRRFRGFQTAFFSRMASVFQLEQGWRMFAPHPLLDDGWIVIPARLADGTEVDLQRNGRPVDFDKPTRVSAEFPTHRWLLFAQSVRGSERHARAYLDWLVSEWNARHGPEQRVASLELIFMQEDTRFDTTEARPRPIKLHALEYEALEASSSRRFRER